MRGITSRLSHDELEELAARIYRRGGMVLSGFCEGRPINYGNQTVISCHCGSRSRMDIPYADGTAQTWRGCANCDAVNQTPAYYDAPYGQ